MSNLLKSNGIMIKHETKRVIDYNPIIANKLDLLQQSVERSLEKNTQDEFVAGIHTSQIEVITNENGNVIYENIIKEANEKALQIIREADDEARNIKENAYTQGKEQGYIEGQENSKKETQLKLQEYSKRENQRVQDYQLKLQEMEPVLLETIADVYQYVFNFEIDKRKDILLHVIHNTVLKLEGSDKFVVKVSPEDYSYVVDNSSLLTKNISETKVVEIIEDSSMVKTQCTIEADGGLYDCSIDVVLDELTKAIKTLAYSK